MSQDTTPPIITGCPDSPIYNIPFGTTSRIVSWIEPRATDDSGVAPTTDQTRSPPDSFSIGVTTVTYVFRDQAGNSATCSFSVTIGRCTFTIKYDKIKQNESQLKNDKV